MRLIKESRCIPLSPCGWAEWTEAVELPQLKAADFTRRILALSESLLLRCAHLWWRPPCARRLLDTVILAVHDRAQCSCHGAPETPHRLLGWTCTLGWHAVPIFVLIAAASLLDLHVCALTVARTSFETRAGRKAGRHISGILHARHGCSVRTLLHRACVPFTLIALVLLRGSPPDALHARVSLRLFLLSSHLRPCFASSFEALTPSQCCWYTRCRLGFAYFPCALVIPR